MIRLYTISRVLAKTTLWILIVLTLFVGLWFAGNRLLDESPHKDRAAFLVSAFDEISDRQNLAIGFLGLTAPKDTDFVEYGSKIASLYRAASYSQILEMMRGPGTLQSTIDPLRSFCWLYQQRKNDDCLPFEQTPEVLRENAELLERFRSLHQLSQYSNLHNFFNAGYIDISRLAIAEIHLHLEQGEHEIAFEKWRDQLLITKNILTGTDGWVGKLGGVALFGSTLPLLENILAADPELAVRHKAELATLLQIDGIEAFNLAGVLRADYQVLKLSLETSPSPNDGAPFYRYRWLLYHFGQEQRILNRYFTFSKDYAEALRQPWSQIDEEMLHLKEKHLYPSLWDILIDPFGTVFLGEFIEGQLKIGDEFIRLHGVDGRLRLAALLVRITAANAEDVAIPAFIEAAGPAYYDPFSNGPMQWDPESRRIYFPLQDNPCVVYQSFRIRYNKSRELLPIHGANMKLC